MFPVLLGRPGSLKYQNTKFPITHQTAFFYWQEPQMHLQVPEEKGSG